MFEAHEKKNSARWPKGRFFSSSFVRLPPYFSINLSDSVDYCIDCTHERPEEMRCWKWMNSAFFPPVTEKRNGNFFIFLHRHTAKSSTIHTCTYFCWHYVKWWIISRHEGYIFYFAVVRGKRYIRGRTNGRAMYEIGFSLSYSDKRFFFDERKRFSSFHMIWLNGRIFLFCKNTKIKKYTRKTKDSSHARKIKACW